MLKLPTYAATQKDRKQVRHERRTAQLVRKLWDVAKSDERRDPHFLSLLTAMAWCNTGRDGTYSKNTPVWRNKQLAEYLRTKSADVMALAAARQNWPKSRHTKWELMLRPTWKTGITNYYHAFRPLALKHIESHSADFARVFAVVARRGHHASRIKDAMHVLDHIPQFKTPGGGYTTVVNAISPALACLDPSQRFPIMNKRTQRLLAAVGKKPNADGASELSDLIGRYGIKNNLELDVYSQRYEFPSLPRPPEPVVNRPISRVVGLKDEEQSMALIKRQRRHIQKIHNMLTNRFRSTVKWKYDLREAAYDLLLPSWKPGRDLLIEVKTSASGSTGRFQIRTAIGQLFDYRRTLLRDGHRQVDLAVLLPQKPSDDVVDLLRSLKMHTLWFRKNTLDGTLRSLIMSLRM